VTTRIPRHARTVYYATETVTREDGRRFAGREQKSTTFREARAFLDGLGVPGGVSVWTASSNLTNAHSTRKEDGSWTALNPYTGNWEPMADVAPARRPYNAANVQYVDRGTIVTALYIPDPEQAKDPAHVLENILDRSKYENVEVVAEATRYYQRDGATFSGWIVASHGDGSHSDPIPNKREALAQLRREVTTYFNRGQ
jgi:hypothetical protein